MESRISWPDANDAAVAAGGYLGTITSAAENSFVFSLVEDDSRFWFEDASSNTVGPWIGAYQDPAPNGPWTWVTGEPFNYENWGGSQPNGNGDYVDFYGIGWYNPDPYWNDYPAPVQGYIMESTSIPEPSTLVGLLSIAATALIGHRWRSRNRGKQAT